MKIARGNVRNLLKILGDIQTLAGKAQSIYLNDRARDRAGELQPVLRAIFDKCVEARSEYKPIKESR